ncbi:MAG: DNA methyltransferase, partial [Pseudomonadota bacterium]
VLSGLPDASVGFSIFSPPFGDLFVYSDSAADMGNVADDTEFADQYRYVAEELARVMRPGRLVAVHCTDLPARKGRDGFIGVRRFSDQLAAIHEAAGFILHCRVTVWRDPVVEMQRTKALGLLHKQVRKDSAMSRTGLPDYLLVFRAPGDNPEPIAHTATEVPVELWQQWASPVWMDIRQSDVLNVRAARAPGDERHLCPLQLDLIERALVLWSNPGDTVLTPFLGIGSEAVQAVKLGRRAIGAELKQSYYDQAVRNVAEAAHAATAGDLFAAETAA